MNLTARKRLNSILGLTLENGRLEASLVVRTNGSAEVRKHTSVGLSLDLMRNEPELVGHEIRNLLDEAGIRERRCVVGIPPEWLLSLHTVLPEGLSEEDSPSFFELEAERSFPTSLDHLQRGLSRHQTSAAQYVTQLAVANDQVGHFEAVLAAAQLRPVRLSPAIAALPGAIPSEPDGVVTVTVGDVGVAVLVAAGGGIVSLRMLNNVFESESSERRLLADVVMRELRITLSQLPADLQAQIRELRILGPGSTTDHFANEVEPRAQRLGLTVTRLTSSGGTEHGLKVKGEAPLCGALSLAVQFLCDAPPALNFLPPKPTLWQQVSRRYSGKRVAYTGATAGVIAAITLAIFVFQGIRLSALRNDWDAMESKVTELDELQQDIREFRPWFDADITSLEILKRVTEAFPEEGSVTAKTLEIQNQTEVNISGITRDNTALLDMLDRMRDVKEIRDVRVDTIRGRTPMQFTFNFLWEDRP